jgi:hypothetical protein
MTSQIAPGVEELRRKRFLCHPMHAVAAAIAAGCNEVGAGGGHVDSLANEAPWHTGRVPGAVSEESGLWGS